ncbi:MAG: outer membrane lipoprotein carrier protein LolA [Pseudomonadota bacterium]
MGTLTGFSVAMALIFADPLLTADMSALPQEAGQTRLEQAAPLTLPNVDQEGGPALDPIPAEDVSIAEQAPVKLAFADKSDEELVAMGRAWLESVETLSGRFIQQAPSGTVSSGTFKIRRPGLLRFDYEPPSKLLIVANGGTVFVRDEALKTTDSYPVGRTPLKFLLRRKIDFEAAKILGVERGPDAYAIALAATDEETDGELSLVFSAVDNALMRWVVKDVRNGLTVVDLFDVEKDKRLNNSLFRIPETESPFLKN